MERLKIKREKLLSALDRLGEAVSDLKKVKQITDKEIEKYSKCFDFFEKENIYRSRRDSLIKRFEFCSDLFWKYLKLYMTDHLKQNVEISSPKTVIRAAHNTKIVTEDDTRKILELIDARNMSSHIYKEEIEDRIGVDIPSYFKVMKKYMEKLIP